MITALDTNIQLDVLVPGAPHGSACERSMDDAVRAGAVVISEPVYAELAAHFPERRELDGFLEATGLRLVSSGANALHRAGKAWSAYVRRRPSSLSCAKCGRRVEARCPRCKLAVRPRQHVVADFLIGAHAMIHADRLLTRDRGYYATYFPELRLG